MANGAGITLFEERLSKRENPDATATAIDPATLAAIIQAIMVLLQGCMTPKPKNLRSAPFRRGRLAVGIYREGGGNISVADAYVHADNTLALVAEAKDEELQLMIDDCCS